MIAPNDNKVLEPDPAAVTTLLLLMFQRLTHTKGVTIPKKTFEDLDASARYQCTYNETIHAFQFHAELPLPKVIGPRSIVLPNGR